MGAEWAKKMGADCDNCPLKDRPAIGTEYPKGHPRLALYGEGPGRLEERIGRPLVGQSGIFVNKTLEQRARIPRSHAQVGNVLACRPAPEERLSEKQWRKAVDSCRPRVEQELAQLPDNTLVLALGGKALQSFSGRKKITPWRGYPVAASKLHIEAMRPSPSRERWVANNSTMVEQVARLLIFPTYHPAHILRSPALLPIWKTDWDRALQLAKTGVTWRWPTFHIHESDEMLAALKRLHKTFSVGVDVETAGTDPKTAPLLCIGVADGQDVVSVPWPVQDPEIKDELIKLLAADKPKKVLQNGNYDVFSLEANGLALGGFDFDTLVAHHVVGAQLPHDLGFIAAGEFPAPRWKSEFRVTDDRKGAGAFARATAEELRTYNSQDAFMTALLRAPLSVRIEDTFNGPQLFEEGMALNALSKKMSEVGIKIDQEVRAAHSQRLKKEIEDARYRWDALSGGISLDFEDEAGADVINPASPKQLGELFFGRFGCEPRFFSKDTGAPSVNVNFLEEVVADSDEPVEARRAAQALLDWRKKVKLKSTYVAYYNKKEKESLIDEHNRLHPNWKQLTITWRWNSSRPNMQNVPPEMRDQYVEDEGMWLVAADYGQLEARIQALLAGETQLIERFNNDKSFDYHGFFTQQLLGVEEYTDAQRRRIKTFNFGDNYGAGAKTLQQQLATRGIFLELHQIEWLQEQKLKMFPGIAAMRESDLYDARVRGYVQIPWGGPRFYFYLGRVKPTQVYNLPIQGGAARLMNPAILAVANELRWDKGEAIVAQIHDELILTGPDPDRLSKLLKKHMEQTVRHGKHEMWFPVDINVGQRWSDLK